MTFGRRALVALVFSLSIAGSVTLFTTGLAARDIEPVLPSAGPQAQPPDAFSLAVLEDLTRRAARTRAEPDRGWLDHLGAYYGERTGGAVFIAADGGFTPVATSSLAEIEQAELWGLDAARFPVPRAPGPAASIADRATAEINVALTLARYAAHARGARIDPSKLSKWLDTRPRPLDAGALVARLAATGDGGLALRDLHPKHPQFELLRQAYIKARGLIAPAARLPHVPPGPRIRPGETHMDVRYIRRRLGVAGKPGFENTYDAELVEAVSGFIRSVGGRGSKRVIDDDLREILNNPPKPKQKREEWKSLLVNMERWRYLPEDMGALHVWNNLPEFETRIVRQGEVIHQERIIIGKPETQTPVFSDQMRYVVFQPEWGVPTSIKIKQLLSHMQDGDYGELERRNMRIMINGRQKDPDDYDWERTDIRYVPIVQGAGPDNPLGQLKFMFPNQHAVYMHDTPTKHLFQSSWRAHSNGCIRVRNPRRLAEIVFGEVHGWDKRDVARLIDDRKAPENNRVDLGAAVPVHNTYFTRIVDETGSVRALSDIYGHDARMVRALDGEPWDSIAQDDPAVHLERELEEMAPSRNDEEPMLYKKKRRTWARG